MTPLDVLYVILAISIPILIGFVIWNLIDLNKVLKRSQKTLKHANRIMGNVDQIVNASRESIKGVMHSIDQINEAVIRPISNLGRVFGKLGTLMSIFTAFTKNDDNKKDKEN